MTITDSAHATATQGWLQRRPRPRAHGQPDPHRRAPRSTSEALWAGGTCASAVGTPPPMRRTRGGGPAGRPAYAYVQLPEAARAQGGASALLASARVRCMHGPVARRERPGRAAGRRCTLIHDVAGAAAGSSTGIAPCVLGQIPSRVASRTAVFSDAELILSSSAGQHHMPPPPVTTAESYVYSRSISADGGASDGSLQSLSGHSQAGDFAAAAYLQDPDALQPCGPSGVPAVVLTSASSSSTLNSMGGLSPAATTTTTGTDEQCNNNSSGGGNWSFELSTQQSCGASHLPWLELGTSGYANGTAAAAVDHYGAALDELKWSDYVFDGYGGGGQYQPQGQCIYGDSKDAVQFADASGLGSSWCLN
ncbi:myb-related protein Zm1-like [Panicum miliaceum]|uniref:Myb-related protein Zm1-like n=1 Tax=Panicum miliaceum TaxID=4540 RepID=A0A3L6QN22_PANMI|nr:myb-related protein Zm1-like [Panicum miliaceum]